MPCLEKIHHFLDFGYSIPAYGKEQNKMEALGGIVLGPVHDIFGLLVIKEQKKCSFVQTMKKIGAVALLILMTPVLLLGLILRGIGALLPHTTYGKDYGKPDRTDVELKTGTSQATIELCYEQVAIFEQVCRAQNFVDSNGLPNFCIIDGTALGACRNGGIIRWDDDVDLMILSKDVEAFLKLKQALKEKGLELHLHQPGLYKLKFTKETLDEYRKKFVFEDKDVPDLDVFVWDQMSDGSFAFSNPISRSAWPTDYMLGQEAGGARIEYPFGPPHKGLKLPGLKREHQEAYLKRYYGENCLDYGVQTHNHQTIKCCGRVFRTSCTAMNAYYFKITDHTPAVGCHEWAAVPAADEAVI